MRVLVTGADGFIGKNFMVHLQERSGIEAIPFTRQQRIDDLPKLLEGVDWVFHLAGINRPKNPKDFITGNVVLSEQLCAAIKDSGKHIPLVYTSSIQAEENNEYGRSKREAENVFQSLHTDTGNPVIIYRLPNVFGKWAKPNYNSVVATFCHNIARNEPIQINDPSAVLRLVYIDDVVSSFMSLMTDHELGMLDTASTFVQIATEYRLTVGELAGKLYRFKETRNDLITEPVGIGLVRALYSTYLSYLPPQHFNYPVQKHCDSRGVFVEMLKTKDAGQFSFFTALPGVTRGGHYHHSKTEKFLVIRGKACFRFRHMLTGEFYELYTSGDQSEIVETVPGWTHDITNVGDDELICMLWANEIFDRERPDTFSSPVGNRA